MSMQPKMSIVSVDPRTRLASMELALVWVIAMCVKVVGVVQLGAS